MYLTGFADEAGADIATQITATRELGWSHIELRRCGSANVHDIPEAEFEAAVVALAAGGVQVNCFGSAIANWAKTIDEPFDSSWAEAQRAVVRMERLQTKLIRIMSFAVRKDAEGKVHDDQMETERFRRLRELVALFADHGITAVHENCNNYGGMGWWYTLRMLDAVPGLQLVYDTGNPTHSDDQAQAPGPDGQRQKQSSWDFYRQVRDHIAYIHIKDGIFDPVARAHVHTFAGDGTGDVRAIVRDLLARGYDGGFSMEPHLKVVFHDPSVQSEAGVRYANYVEYGRRFERLLAEARADVGAAPAQRQQA